MNENEKFKQELLTSIMEELPELTVAQLRKVEHCIDKCISEYDIVLKELALSVQDIQELPALVKIYIATKKMEDRSMSCIKNSFYILRSFFSSVNKNIQAISPTDVRMYLYNYQQEHKIQNSSVNSFLGYISRFYKWCIDEGYLSTNPAHNIKPLREVKKVRPYLTSEEIKKLREACINAREHTLVETFISTGCRIAEIAAIKVGDIQLDESKILVFGKNSKERYVYLTPEAQAAIIEYINTNNLVDDDYLFHNWKDTKAPLSTSRLRQLLERVLSRADISKHITPHCLRHTLGTTLLHKGMPVENIQKILGHSQISTTMKYAHNDTNSAELQFHEILDTL